VVVSVYVHSLQSMVVAPKKYVWSTVSSPAQRAGGRTCRMAKSFGVFVCVYRILLVLKDLFLFLKSHIWHGPKSHLAWTIVTFGVDQRQIWHGPKSHLTWTKVTFGMDGPACKGVQLIGGYSNSDL
jgi:hypothetical protein